MPKQSCPPLQMGKLEIVSSYRTAKDQKKQLQVLADLNAVTITDSSGAKLLTVGETEITPINNGSVSIAIPMGTVALSLNTEFTLTFDTAVGHAKAEQPLPMSGNWSCTVIVNES